MNKQEMLLRDVSRLLWTLYQYIPEIMDEEDEESYQKVTKQVTEAIRSGEI